MADFTQLRVREWDVQYYQETNRKWLTGVLSVTVEGIHFQEKDSSFSLKYSNFGDVRKTTTGLIFGAVVIIIKDGQQHWFSSLPNRENVFNVIQYFLHSNITFSDKENGCERENTVRTEMGRKLLTVVSDSHKTLGTAAEKLSSQGAQIDSALTSMTDIHNDLDIADEITSGMESWFGKWRIPNVYKKVDPVIVHDRDIPEISEYEILFTKMEINKMNTQKLGLLRIAPEGLFILTEKQKLVHHFKWSDISRARVLSPCEVLLTRFLIGQPDLTFGVVCTSLLGFLKFLEKRLRSKVEYLTSGFVRQQFDDGKSTTKVTPQRFGVEKGDLLSRRSAPSSTPQLHTSHGQGHTPPHEDQRSSSGGAQERGQVQLTDRVVSEEEVEELQQTLSDLRSLAIAVQRETDVQNEKLDTLTTSVDNANIRVGEVNSRVVKLNS